MSRPGDRSPRWGARPALARTLAALALAVPAALAPAFAARATEKVPLAAAEGAPTIAPGSGPAYYLWWDAAGWHLRWTGRKPGAAPASAAPPAGPGGVGGKPAAGKVELPVFTGLVRAAESRIALVKPAGMVGGDDSVNRLDATRLMFKSACGDAVEGVDFKTAEGATSLYLELFLDYDVIGPAMVFLGKDRTVPRDISPLLQVDLTGAPGLR